MSIKQEGTTTTLTAQACKIGDHFTLTPAQLTVSTPAHIEGETRINANVTIDKKLTVGTEADIKGDLTVGANATVKQDLTVEAEAQINDKLTVNQATTLNKGVSVTGQMSITGDSESNDAILHLRNDPNRRQNLLQIEDTNADPSPIVVKSDGEMGIGTDDPQNKLDIRGNVRVGPGETVDGQADSLSVAGQVGIGTHQLNNKLDVQGSVRVGPSEVIDGQADSLSVAGQVGIGTHQLNNKLDVHGSVRIGQAERVAEECSLSVEHSVGIGTAEPTARLDISHQINDDRPLLSVGQRNTNIEPSRPIQLNEPTHVDADLYVEEQLEANTAVIKETVTAAQAQLTTQVEIGQAPNQSSALLNVQNPNIKPHSELLRVTGNNLDSAVMVIKPEGKVGINQVAPEKQLDIQGEVKIWSKADAQDQGRLTVQRQIGLGTSLPKAVLDINLTAESAETIYETEQR